MFKKSIALAAALALGGCASVDTEMSASSDINPDMNGNPSPIAVSVFELSSPSAFMAADFIHLYTEAPVTLGASLLLERNLMLVPGTSEKLSLPVVKGVTAVGYVAAYQDVTATQWRQLVPVAPSMMQGVTVTVSLDNQGIHIANNPTSAGGSL